MIRINTLLRVAVAIGVAAFGFGINAANLTVSIPACSSYSLTNNVLTCTTGNACSITGPSSALSGATVTLNGSCAASSTLTWGGCTSATGGTCTLNPGATFAGPVSVTLNGSLGETPASQVVTFGGAANCSVLPGSASVAINTSGQTFSASCNFTPTTYAWTGCTSTSSTCTVPAQGTLGTVNVSVAASDGGANSATGNGSVTFVPNAAGGIPKTCNDGTSTVAALPIGAFDNSANIVDPYYPGLTAVYPIVVPSLPAGKGVQFAFSSTGGFSDHVGRWVWVSKTPCTLASDTSSNTALFWGVQSGTINGVIDPTRSAVVGAGSAAVIHMTPGDTWYIIIQTLKSSRQNSCTSPLTSCPMQVQAAVIN